MPIGRRQDWRKWDAEITRLEEKLRAIKRLKADIEEAEGRVANPS